MLALLRTLDTELLSEAFDRLGREPFQLEVRAEQLGENGTATARQVRTFRTDRDGTTTVAADSAGAFDYGALGRLVDQPAWGDAPTGNPVAEVLPEEPAWLDPRGREAFRFGSASDTLLGGRRVRVLTVEARTGTETPLRRARLWLDADMEALVGVRLRRELDSVLFGEASDAVLLLHPGPDGWRPHLARFETKLRAPLTAPHHFRLTRRYTFADSGVSR